MKLTEEESLLYELIGFHDKHFPGYGTGVTHKLFKTSIHILRNAKETELEAWSIKSLFLTPNRKFKCVATSKVVKHPITHEDYRLIDTIKMKSRNQVELSLVDALEILERKKERKIKHLPLEDVL